MNSKPIISSYILDTFFLIAIAFLFQGTFLFITEDLNAMNEASQAQLRALDQNDMRAVLEIKPQIKAAAKAAYTKAGLFLVGILALTIITQAPTWYFQKKQKKTFLKYCAYFALKTTLITIATAILLTPVIIIGSKELITRTAMQVVSSLITIAAITTAFTWYTQDRFTLTTWLKTLLPTITLVAIFGVMGEILKVTYLNITVSLIIYTVAFVPVLIFVRHWVTSIAD